MRTLLDGVLDFIRRLGSTWERLVVAVRPGRVGADAARSTFDRPANQQPCKVPEGYKS